MAGWSNDGAPLGAANDHDHTDRSATRHIETASADRCTLAWRIGNLRRFDLNLLLSLHALLHTRNVTQAGDWLGVTQPAMSSDLRRLRHMLKDELLVRVGRGYQLTPLASSLVQPLTRAIADIEHALTWQPVFDPGVDTRSFSVAMSDHIMALFLPVLATRLPREAPHVTIHTRGLSGLSQYPVTAALEGEVDLSIGAFETLPDAHSEALYTERWVCAVSDDHPDVDDQMSLELFCRLPHLEWRLRTPVVTSHAEMLYASKGIERQVLLTTESFALLPAILRGSRMVALVHERLARRVPGLKLLAPPVPIPDVVESMYWSTSVGEEPGHAWLRNLMRSIATAL